jgi:hypothetical protein
MCLYFLQGVASSRGEIASRVARLAQIFPFCDRGAQATRHTEPSLYFSNTIWYSTIKMVSFPKSETRYCFCLDEKTY